MSEHRKHDLESCRSKVRSLDSARVLVYETLRA